MEKTPLLIENLNKNVSNPTRRKKSADNSCPTSQSSLISDRTSTSSEVQFLHFDDFLDILGGAKTLAETHPVHKKQQSQFYPSESYEKINQLFLLPNQFLFPPQISKAYSLEVLYLKMVSFSKLLKEIQISYLTHKKPHLGISPQNILVSVQTVQGAYPIRWGFNLSLSPPNSCSPDGVYCKVTNSTLFQPVKSPDDVYFSRRVDKELLCKEARVNVVITELEPLSSQNEGKNINLKCLLDLSSTSFKSKACSTNDFINLHLNCNDPEIDNLSLWGRVFEKSDDAAKIDIFLDNVGESCLQALEKRKGATFFESKIFLYKNFSFSHDLYALGKILSRTLFLNDKNNLEDIGKKQHAIFSVLADDETKNSVVSKRIEEKVIFLIQNEKPTFCKDMVLFDGKDRAQQNSTIPEVLWEEILQLMFRLTEDPSGFLYPNDNLCNFEQMNRVMENLIFLLEEINTMLHIELFQPERQNSKIKKVLQNILQDQQSK